MIIPPGILLPITQFCQNEVSEVNGFLSFFFFFLQAPVVNDFLTLDKADKEVIFKELQICM